MFGTLVPASVKNLHSQKSATDANDEFYEKLLEPPQFLTVHRVFQGLMFLVFFGPFKILAAAGTFVLWLVVLNILPFLRRFCKWDMEFKTLAHSISRHFLRLFLLSIGIVKINVEGTLGEQARIFASNSVCVLDYLVHFCLGPVTFVKKTDETGSEQLLVGNVFDTFRIKPKKGKAHYQIEKAASDPSFFPLLVFPEGTATNGDAILRFEDDAFHNEYQFQPVAIQYFMALTPRGFNSLQFDRSELLQFILRVMCVPFMTVTVTYLNADIPKMESSPEAKAKWCQLKIANHLGCLAITQGAE